MKFSWFEAQMVRGRVQKFKNTEKRPKLRLYIGKLSLEIISVGFLVLQ